MTAPCHNCEDRHAGCHSACERYAEFARINAEERRIRNEKAKSNAAITGAIIEAAEKRRRKSHER